ncbi:MAG TPA: response regulator transcription factor [Actinophytocola sp.]|jgi:DNA-binding NarL/FixJ family response regulator|uniref:response regulator n=1 Tax=Actinophytocola sp. TaxID=1872138 RepID=UPI002F94CDAE
MKVLIADDSVQMRQALTYVIEAEPDMRVLAAASADEAVELAAAHLPDVAVLDVHMPGNGVVAADRIRRVAPDARLIVLTGDATALSRPDCDRLGLSDFLVKGVPNATIIAAIRRAGGSRPAADA